MECFSFGGRKGEVVVAFEGGRSASPGGGRARPGTRPRLLGGRARCGSDDAADVVVVVLAAAALAALDGGVAFRLVDLVQTASFAVRAGQQAVCREFRGRAVGDVVLDAAAQA